jgi:hypothetical protein
VSFLVYEWAIGLQINWVGPNLVDLEIIYSETLSAIRHRGPAHSGFFLPRISSLACPSPKRSSGGVRRSGDEKGKGGARSVAEPEGHAGGGV